MFLLIPLHRFTSSALPGSTATLPHTVTATLPHTTVHLLSCLISVAHWSDSHSNYIVHKTHCQHLPQSHSLRQAQRLYATSSSSRTSSLCLVAPWWFSTLCLALKWSRTQPAIRHQGPLLLSLPIPTNTYMIIQDRKLDNESNRKTIITQLLKWNLREEQWSTLGWTIKETST
jgi:hypothetical protein